ncbi:MAG: EAL domain-containing protein [Eubacterium sp.]|nr:EAL domain-containing protein [Eubacterium sp.]
MRFWIAATLIFIIASLTVCAIKANRSKKAIRKAVALLVCSTMPPVMGNLIIICSRDKLYSQIGYYIYFLGMDIFMYAIFRFTFEYCHITKHAVKSKRIVLFFMMLDFIQYIVNIFTGHVFDTRLIEADGADYYQLVPYLGQTFHRILDYGILAIVLIIFIVKTIRSPKIYAERYLVILITMVVVSAWETYYIFSRTPVDSSMIGFGVYGILVFYFSLYYRPLRLLDSMLASIASGLPEALYFFDMNRTCIWTNVLGEYLLDLKGNNLESAKEKIRTMFGDCPWESDEWNARKKVESEDGNKYYYLEKHGVFNETGKRVGSYIRVRDVTEEQEVLEKEKYNATHDSLTDIYTKKFLFETFAEMLKENPNIDYYVIYSNINDFKIVNDIFGNQFGDYVLKYIAGMIQAEMEGKGIAGRLVGDTFGMCIPVDKFNEADIVRELTHFTVTDGDIEHYVLMHLGVYRVIDRTLDVSYMFDRARIALSTIKDDYHTYIAYFDSEMREKVLWEQKITTQLSGALTEGQIVPFLQPIVDAEKKVVGAEALVRWNHSEEGFLAPYKFIPVFEKNGMIADIDRYMWRRACELLYQWNKAGIDMFISINISPKDFYFMDVGIEIRNIVKEFGINQERLRIEITETVMMSEQDNIMNILNDFRRDGFIVEMDDFGSGYSSLNMLKDMPIDLIKIDMAFLRKSENSDKAEIILKNIVRLSSELGLIALTEGVETEEQYQLLAGLGCSLFQGYHFAKPMPVEEFEDKYIKRRE